MDALMGPDVPEDVLNGIERWLFRTGRRQVEYGCAQAERDRMMLARLDRLESLRMLEVFPVRDEMAEQIVANALLYVNRRAHEGGWLDRRVQFAVTAKALGSVNVGMVMERG